MDSIFQIITEALTSRSLCTSCTVTSRVRILLCACADVSGLKVVTRGARISQFRRFYLLLRYSPLKELESQWCSRPRKSSFFQFEQLVPFSCSYGCVSNSRCTWYHGSSWSFSSPTSWSSTSGTRTNPNRYEPCRTDRYGYHRFHIKSSDKIATIVTLCRTHRVLLISTALID